MTKVACVTGATGNIGSHVVDELLADDWKIFALKRRSSSFNTERIDHCFHNPNLKLVYGDMTDPSSIATFVKDNQPDIFINCAAQSFVQASFLTPLDTFNQTGSSVLNCLEAIRRYSPHSRFVTCSSSEMYGSTPPPQNEETPFHPRSPYAVAKLAGYYATINYRESFGMFASNSINFNTEGPRRGPAFVTRKITMGACKIKLGLQAKLVMGPLDKMRDWGHPTDVARGLIAIVNHKTPGDFVLATNKMRSVREFAELVFSKLGMDYKDYIEFSEQYVRPAEVDALMGDYSKAQRELGWSPRISFEEMVEEMIQTDMKLAQQELLLKNNQ